MAERTPDWLSTWAVIEPERPALRATASAWTTRQLDGAAAALAVALAEQGVAAGDRVAALLEDDAPAVVLLHALRRVGAVLAPLNRRGADPELLAQLARLSPRVLAHDDTHAARAERLAADLLAEDLAGDGAAEISPLVTWDAAAALAAAPLTSADAERPAIIRLDEPATIVFTSGTSCQPRPAVLSHRNHVASADAWAAVLLPRAEDRWLACLPLFHVAGLAIVMRASRWGVPLEVLPRFDASEVAARIAAGCSHVSLVPPQLEQLLEIWAARPVPASLRAVLLGGAPIPGPVLARARGMGLPILVTYGMTETASGVAVGGLDPATLADPTALRPLPGVRLREAATPEGDEEGSGGIEVRGPMVFGGYLDDPEATAERLVDGWLHTGDLGSVAKDGLLRVMGRRDDVVISGGENIQPAEVEAVLCEHPAVAEAAVVGQADPTWGGVPVAAIVLVPEADVADDELAAHCRARLAGYKVPRRFVRVLALPRNAAGKVLRRELQATLLVDAPVGGRGRSVGRRGRPGSRARPG